MRSWRYIKKVLYDKWGHRTTQSVRDDQTWPRFCTVIPISNLIGSYWKKPNKWHSSYLVWNFSNCQIHYHLLWATTITFPTNWPCPDDWSPKTGSTVCMNFILISEITPEVTFMEDFGRTSPSEPTFWGHFTIAPPNCLLPLSGGGHFRHKRAFHETVPQKQKSMFRFTITFTITLLKFRESITLKAS